MSEDWHYSHKNDQGYDVNSYGYDKNGIYRGTNPFNNYENNQIGKIKSKKNNNSVGTGGLGGLIIIGIIIFMVIKFVKSNIVSIIVIAIIIYICVILCVNINKKLSKKITKYIAHFVTIITSMFLIGSIIYLGPIQHDGNFKRFFNDSNIKIRSFAYVDTDVLNVRSGPSSNEKIIGVLYNGDRVNVINDSESWWKIKKGNIEGYVNSEFLKY